MHILNVITGSINTAQDICEQLNSYFSGFLSIRYYCTDLGFKGTLERGVYLFSSSEVYFDTMNMIELPKESEIIIATRTFDTTKLIDLMEIPLNKKVLLVNDSKTSAIETLNKLNGLGLESIDWIPFYPESAEVPKNIYCAVTPNEIRYVPKNINRVINIGSRILDYYTLTLIMEKFSLRNSLEIDISMKNIKELLNYSRQLYIENVNNKMDSINRSSITKAIKLNKDEIDKDVLVIFSGNQKTSQYLYQQLLEILGNEYNILTNSIDDGHEVRFKSKLIIFSSIEIYYEAYDLGVEFINCELIFASRVPAFSMMNKLFQIDEEHDHVLIGNDSETSASESLEAIKSYGFNMSKVDLWYPSSMRKIKYDKYKYIVCFGNSEIFNNNISNSINNYTNDDIYNNINNNSEMKSEIEKNIIDLGYRVLDHYSIMKILILIGESESNIRKYTNAYHRQAFIYMSLSNKHKKAVMSANEKLESSYFETVKAMAMAIDAKDKYTSGHCDRVMEYSMKLGERLSLSKEDMDILKFSSILHDIGKIGIPDEVLNKPSKLTDNEYELIKSHSEIGSQILENIEFLKRVSQVIRNHHERIDGKGYPDMIKNGEIGVIARIIAIADAYDAMTSNRPYREAALSKEEAIAELKNNSSKQFDAELVELFCGII